MYNIASNLMEFLEGSVKPLSEKLTAKSRRAKIKLTL